MTTIEQYNRSRVRFHECIYGIPDGCETDDIFWFAGLGDHYCELLLLEDRLLDAMEGLA